MSPIGALSRADPAPTVHYALAENLEHIDIGLIDNARREIDFAAYVLTGWPIMQALARAAEHGVKARIYLDTTQLAEREVTKLFEELAHTLALKSVSSARAQPSRTLRAMSGALTFSPAPRTAHGARAQF